MSLSCRFEADLWILHMRAAPIFVWTAHMGRFVDVGRINVLIVLLLVQRGMGLHPF